MSNATQLAEVWVHPFEKSGLGKAPFACIGYAKLVYQACQGAPVQCGGSCDFCGTGIMHSYTIRSADGRTFKVGSDCLERTRDTKLIEEQRAAERAYEAEQRRLAWEAEAPERERRERAEKATREAKLLAQAEINAQWAAMLIEGARVVLASNRLSDYDRSVVARIHEELTSGTRQPGLVIDEEDESRGHVSREWLVLSSAYIATTLPPNVHVGRVGERLRNFSCRYLGGPTIGIDSPYGASVLTKFLVVDGPMAGAVMLWKTKYHPASKGAYIRLTATVKAHDEYKGQLQTVITRGKVEE